MTDAALTPLSSAERRHFDWLQDKSVRKIIAALEAAAPGASRFVGGCVRDSLLDQKPKDIDIATQLTPDKVMDALRAAGLSAVPTGIDHGTITAIADHRGVEVTTLRADVSTDGRRATVAFTKDWSVDAGRRDFRLNAIYLTPDGALCDPVGGVSDAKAGRVRFIGEPADRIREDYLRILRFFRFSARFADSFDDVGLAACAAEKAGIAQLSAERVGAEFLQILELPTALEAIKAMQASGILQEVWKTAPDLTAFAELKTLAPASAAPVGLAALFSEEGDGLGARLRLSKAEDTRRKKSLKAADDIEPKMSEADAHKVMYRFGATSFGDGVLLAAARRQIDPRTYERLSATGRQWTPPVLPVSGKDVLALGVSAGKIVSTILSAVERRWVDEDFPDEPRVSEILEQEVETHTN